MPMAGHSGRRGSGGGGAGGRKIISRGIPHPLPLSHITKQHYNNTSHITFNSLLTLNLNFSDGRSVEIPLSAVHL